MDDSNASYGFNDLFFEYPPASEDPPEDIFEDQNLNDSLQEASTSQEIIDPNDSAASGNESAGSSQDRSFGLPGLFQQVDLTPPDDLFEVGSLPTSETPISICSSHSSLSELLTPGSPGTIHEIFGSAVEPVEELQNEQASTNSDSSDSSGTMTCPGPSPTFLSESESDSMLLAGDFSLSNTDSFGTNTLASFESTGFTPGNPESSAVLDAAAAAAFINYELSLNLDTLTKLSSPHGAQRIETDSGPSTASHAVPQPGSLYFHDHPSHNVSTDFIPPTLLLEVPQPGSPNLHSHLGHNSWTDSLPSTSFNAVRPKGSPYSSCNPMQNPATVSVPSSPSLAPRQEELPYSFRHPRRNSATESIPSTLSQAGRQEVSPYSRRHPRRRAKADSEPSTYSQSSRQEGSSNSRRNSTTCSMRAAQLLNPSAAFVTPLRLQNVGSSPNSMGSDELSFNTMEVSRPVFHGQQGSLAESQASVTPIRPSSLDVLSGSIISSRKVTRCPRCPALRFHPQGATVTDLERCMFCGSRTARE